MKLIKNTIVINTSPIIYLSSLEKIDILKALFGEVLIPESVKKEIISGGKNSFGFKEINEKKWIRVSKIRNRSAKKYLLTDLDDGEAEVIVLAEEAKANLIVMDDRLGRRIAKLRGYNVIGTLKLLILAKEKGLIPEVKSRLNKLRSVGFWVSEEVYNAILQQTGEK